MALVQDVRLGFRLLRRAPLSTAIACASIALGVGATAVVFAAVKSVLIDALPYTRAHELVLFRTEYSKIEQQSSDIGSSGTTP